MPRTASSRSRLPRPTRSFTERGLWNTFRTCGRDDQQGGVAGAYLAANFKDAKIAVVHDKTPTARASPTRPRRR